MSLAPGDRVVKPDFIFYRLTHDTPAVHLPAPPSEHTVTLWRPGARNLVPDALPLASGTVWWLFHQLHLFRNRGYAHLVIKRGNQAVHRSAVFPGWLRFPFMAPEDLQIGNTWTDPSHRGRGLASYAISEIVNRLRPSYRTFWYIVAADNTPSIRAAQRAGFQEFARGRQIPRLGLRLLGSYQPMDRPAASPKDSPR